MPIEFGDQCAIVHPNTSLEEFEDYLNLCFKIQRDCLWQLGDITLALERQHPNTFHQAYPVKVSPDLVSRCQAVSAAYKREERNIDATWSTHRTLSKRPDRVAAVAASVEAGQTSDEARKNPPPPQVEEPKPDPAPAEPAAQPAMTQPAATPAVVASSRWLLAVDANYYVHSRFAKAGVDTAVQTVEWMERLIERLHKSKNLTDVVFCFDSPNNHRRALTEGWDQPYKERTEKDPELLRQLQLIPELLQRHNRLCVSIDGMEADDVMASYAKQFDGKVTLMTADKDLRQCLSAKCNILRDTEWEQNDQTGILMPIYKWVVGKWPEDREKPDNIVCHMTDVLNYQGAAVKGISPELWPHFQAIAGDSGDDIDGVKGIGGKIAMALIIAHGTVQQVIAAAKDGIAAVTNLKRMAILDFEPFAETTLLLTTMRTDLDVPQTTRISMKAD